MKSASFPSSATRQPDGAARTLIRLDPRAGNTLARYAYLAHHEGLKGATAYLQGENLSAAHLNQNVPKDQKDYWLDHYGPDLSTAYRFFMNRWTDDKIDVTRYMYDPGGIAPPATATLYGRRK
jgi:hypothetical protein